MSSTQTAPEVLDRHFLEARARILEVAAILDRMDRADGTVGNDPRADQLRSGIEILLQENQNRAEQIQQLFSRAYSSSWRKEMGV